MNTGKGLMRKVTLILILALTLSVDFAIILFARGSKVGFFIEIGKKKGILLLLENLLILILIVGKKKWQEKFRDTIGIKILNVVTCLITPVMIFFVVQIIIGQGEFTVQNEYLARNLILYYAVYLLFLTAFRKVSSAISMYTIVLVVLALVDYYVTLFRGKAFVLMDVFSIGTAAEVSGNYEFSIPVIIGICLLGVMIFLVYQVLFQSLILGKKNHNIKEMVIRLVVFAGICGAIYGNWNRLNIEGVDQWDTANEYKNKGYAYVLVCETQYLQIEKPENYSVDTVQEIAEAVNTESLNNNSVENAENTTESSVVIPQNLIVIMNESLADFEEFDNLKASEEILPNIHNLHENTKKGYLYVPAFGGGTADTEYEVLTGNTKEFLPNGGIAYQEYCRDPEYGLANTLKQENYSATAVHPFKANGWNRTNVYSWMNFDDFISMDNWGGKFKKMRRYASDKAAYKKLKKLYENKENENMFLFCVTMQNHGGYDPAKNFTPDVSLGYEESYPSAEMYLSLAKRSDEAFEGLIEYFSEVEEPTMIVMFGDHWPNLDWGFFSQLYGKDFGTLDLTEVQSYHRTPYVIWTNYPSESTEEDMSANYFGSYILEQAGLEMTTYNKFLLQLKETLPVIGSGAVCDASGNWYALDALPDEYAQLINQYKILQYNNVADRSHRIDSIFTISKE